eukprot:gb/GECH01007230.1/.p1 GENE.gb/GECH01007230.1/~~gb/GECH01007230.1/.p1  ORF type:complete len:269 (+),score=70.61 gb/GECH01007230.1/:1-807(+)
MPSPQTYQHQYTPPYPNQQQQQQQFHTTPPPLPSEDIQEADIANKNISNVLHDLSSTATPPSSYPPPYPPSSASPSPSHQGGGVTPQPHPHPSSSGNSEIPQHQYHHLRYTIQGLDRHLAHARSLLDRCRDFIPNNSKGLGLLRELQEFDDSFGSESAEHIATVERRQWEQDRAIEQRERLIASRERAAADWEGDAAQVMREFMTRAQAQHKRQSDLQDRLRQGFSELRRRQSELANRERALLDLHRRADPYHGGTTTASTPQSTTQQ